MTQKEANKNYCGFLSSLARRIINADASNFTLGIRGDGELPQFVEQYLTKEQWDDIKQMLVLSINKKITDIKALCLTSDSK